MNEMSGDIFLMQKELNKNENIPRMAYRRDSKAYPLVCYVNNITGCFLSENYKPIALFSERAKIYIEENKNEEMDKYYKLVKHYLSLIDEVCTGQER